MFFRRRHTRSTNPTPLNTLRNNKDPDNKCRLMNRTHAISNLRSQRRPRGNQLLHERDSLIDHPTMSTLDRRQNIDRPSETNDYGMHRSNAKNEWTEIPRASWPFLSTQQLTPHAAKATFRGSRWVAGKGIHTNRSKQSPNRTPMRPSIPPIRAQV